MATKPTLVLGGTGKTGRRVVERLAARRIPFASVPDPASRRSTGTTSRRGRRRRRREARVRLALPGRCPGSGRTVRSFADLAVKSGVRRLVLLSGRGEAEAERVEQAVRDSGAELTILRSTWFAQNFSENYWLEEILSGELALPAGEVPEPFVDVDDIADVAVAALTDDRHIGELYELTGRRLLTFADAVDEIGQAAGREVRYVPVAIDDYAAAAGAQGVPGDVIELLTYLFAEVLDGRNAYLADGVQRALGREPRDFVRLRTRRGRHRRLGLRPLSLCEVARRWTGSSSH